MGYLAWRTGQQNEALKFFESSVELGSRNPQMLWDYGRMANRSNSAQAMRALQLLLADQPARMEVRLVLAQIQMNGKLAKEAIETLSPVKKVTPADAPQFFLIMAFANMEVGNRGAARANAQGWMDNVQDPDRKLEASRLIRYLDSQEAEAQRAAVASQTPTPLPRRNDDGANSISRPVPASNSPVEPTPEASSRPELRCLPFLERWWNWIAKARNPNLYSKPLAAASLG